MSRIIHEFTVKIVTNNRTEDMIKNDSRIKYELLDQVDEMKLHIYNAIHHAYYEYCDDPTIMGFKSEHSDQLEDMINVTITE